jgi:phage baseplate assembly protein W
MDIKFPLVENDISVFERADLVQTARQKLKNIVLTNPGERVMLPNFGVGIKRYLFSQNSEQNFINVSSDIQRRISDQVNQYAQNLSIVSVNIDNKDENTLNVRIVYNVNNLFSDTLEIVV